MTSDDDGFTATDWALLAAVALMWGSSFLLIEIALADLDPATIAWLRIVLGALTLGLVPAARRRIARSDLAWVALLGLVWMALPFSLFAFAQRSITSSLAGMINGAAPLFTVLVATLWTRRSPTPRQLVGFLLGFGGVVAINLPGLTGAGEAGDGVLLGAAMVLGATVCYGLAFNLAEPLERRNGVLPVIWRAQVAAAVLTAPTGLSGATRSDLGWASLGAMLLLGALSTGLAFALFTTLVSRVGAARGSVTVYFIPVVAIAVGVVVLAESVTAWALAGTALVLLGAFLSTRRRPSRRLDSSPAAAPHPPG